MSIMTPKLVLSNIKDALAILAWPSSVNVVFGNHVYVVPEFPAQQMGQFPRPFALVVDQGESNHPEHPLLITQYFTVMCFVENFAQNYGEGVVLGRNRVANKSDGAGTKDVTAVILTDLVYKIALGASKCVLVSKTRSKFNVVAANAPTCTVSLSFESFASLY